MSNWHHVDVSLISFWCMLTLRTCRSLDTCFLTLWEKQGGQSIVRIEFFSIGVINVSNGQYIDDSQGVDS